MASLWRKNSIRIYGAAHSANLRDSLSFGGSHHQSEQLGPCLRPRRRAPPGGAATEDQLSFCKGGAFHTCLKLETRMPTRNFAPPSRFRLLGFERSHIDREAVPHIGLKQSLVGFVDPLDGDDFDIGGNVMRPAKVEHLLGFGDAADGRAGETAASHD